MSVISLAALGLGMSTLYHMNRAPTPADLVKNSLSKTCKTFGDREHSCERQIWVDTPLNTWLRNDRLQMTSVEEASQYVRSQYAREASEHPGVRLVAHTVR